MMVFSFKEVVVYVDISDIQDEAISYVYQDGKVFDMNPENGLPVEKNNFINELKINIKNTFPLTYHSMYLLKGKLKPSISLSPSAEIINWDYFSKNHTRSNWTYNLSSNGYGSIGVGGAIEKSTKLMNDLYLLLSKNDIGLSIGVYPWPAQLLYGSEDSIQVRIWQDFCKEKCNNFYNSFPLFFQEFKQYEVDVAIDKIFISRDIHYNRYGMSLVSKNFIDSQ